MATMPTETHGPGRHDWGWDAHADAQRESWSRASPQQRLEWLEAALRFAHRVGALPRTEATGDRGSD